MAPNESAGFVDAGMGMPQHGLILLNLFKEVEEKNNIDDDYTGKVSYPPLAGGNFPAADNRKPMPLMTPQRTPPPADWENITTVMFRNFPNKYSQKMLRTEINQAGFLGTYDFLYLPIDPETGANRGYAFLNFLDPGFAWMCKMAFEGRKMNNFNSHKVVSVVPATLQGFEANYAHYSTARVNRGDPSARPLFLREPTNKVPSNMGGNGRSNRRGNLSRKNLESSAPPPEVTISAPIMPMAPAMPAKEAKFCMYCGGSIQAAFQFCPHCGGNISLG